MSEVIYRCHDYSILDISPPNEYRLKKLSVFHRSRCAVKQVPLTRRETRCMAHIHLLSMNMICFRQKPEHMPDLFLAHPLFGIHLHPIRSLLARRWSLVRISPCMPSLSLSSTHKITSTHRGSVHPPKADQKQACKEHQADYFVRGIVPSGTLLNSFTVSVTAFSKGILSMLEAPTNPTLSVFS